MVERTDCFQLDVKMKATSAALHEYLTLLGETLHRITSITEHFDEASLQAKPDKGEWSANVILAHLRSCADVWGDQIEKMLLQDSQNLPYRHPRQWINKTSYRELPFHDSFQAFQAQRGKLLEILKE